MTKTEKEKVKAYLNSIKRSQIALINLEKALAGLEERYESPPTWMSNPDAIAVCGGTEGSKQEDWSLFQEAYPERKSFLKDKIKATTAKIDQFTETLTALNEEGHFGSLGVQIIRHKYLQKISPDEDIYRLFLFCTMETFYRAHRFAIKFFYDAMPDRFQTLIDNRRT